MPSPTPTLRVYLHGDMLRTAREGTFPAMALLARTMAAQGWRVSFDRASPAAHDTAPPPGDYAMFHMKRPAHPRTLTLRRAYHYPFWWIEPVAERWRFAVAQAAFDPTGIGADEAAAFTRRLRARILKDEAVTRGDAVLVPLQGHIRRARSFQTMSPVQMLDAVCRTGRPVTATLHPSEVYDPDDRAALAGLAARYPRLTIGGDTRDALRDCAFVATENSAVAFDGLILGKPAVLFAQIDFHHIALNVAALGAEEALAAAPRHAPDFDRYVTWFLRRRAIDAQAPDGGDRMLAAMRRGGWPV